jgi:hypothetical protein
MSILDAQRYVESMTRKEIADALKKGGHPLVPAFVLADRAEQLKKNDAAVKKMEEMAGIPAPNQDIGSKLAQYLEANMRAEEEKSRGGLGMPGQGVGEPMPKPGMPPVPGGAGKPMPGATAFGQGTPMAKAGGGLIPRYQDRGLVQEEDFMGDLAVADGTIDVGSALAAMREEAEAGRLTTERPESAFSRYLSGFPDRIAAANRNAIAGTTYAGTRGTSRFSPQVMMPELSNAAELSSGIAALEDMFKRKEDEDERRVQSLYDMISGRIGDMRTAATTETVAEADLREAREGFAQRIRSRKQDIRDILPTEEQDKLRTSATMLELISDTMGARSTDPANSGFGRIARGMRELGQQRQERDLGIEELMFGLDKGAFDVEDRNRAGLATLSRAGERYDESEFDLMLAQYEAQGKALLEAQKGGQGLYKPAQWASVINFLEGPESVEIPEADRTRIQQILVQSMTGNAAGMPAGTRELLERYAAGDLSEEEGSGLLGTLARTIAGAGVGGTVGGFTPLGPFGVIPGAIIGGVGANVVGG